MRYIIVIAGLLASSCSTTGWKQVALYPDENGLNRFENEEVVCYMFINDDNISSMSCLPKK